MGFGDFLKGAAESVGKKVDDAAEGVGEVVTDVGKTVAADARESAHDVNQWRQGNVGDPRSLIGDAGSLAGGALRGVGSALNTAGDVTTRLDSWINPHDNQSEAEWTKSYTDFVGEHGMPSDDRHYPYGSGGDDYKITQEYQSLMDERPYGLKKDDPEMFGALGDKLSGGGNAVEAVGKAAETFTRAPVESTQFAWDNRAEAARQTTNYVQSQFTPEALGEWGLAAGGAVAIATARSGRGGRGAPHGEPMAPHTAPRPATPEAPISTSRYSQGVIPTTFPKTRQRIANVVAGPAEARGIIPSTRRVLARNLEPQGRPPSQRPNSRAAEAGTSRFTEAMWETKQWGARIAATKLASDIAGVGQKIPTEAVENYDPEKAAEGFGEYNDFAAGRSVQQVGRDMLTDPKQRAEALSRAEGLGLDTSAAQAAAEEYANKALPGWKDYVIPGGIAAGGAAIAAAQVLGERGGGTGDVQAAQPEQPTQTAQAAQTADTASYSKKKQPEGISFTTPTARMDSFGAGTSAKPGKAARPSVVSGDFGFREPSVEHPLGSNMADGSQGPRKSALYAGISQTSDGARMQQQAPGQRKRGEAFVSGSVYGEQGATMSGTQAWNANTKGSFVFPDLVQPKPKNVLGV